MEYYYAGCPSWGWFYPYHYAPFCSDVAVASTEGIGFTQGKPFKPFQQLMAVFPASSGHALPEPYREVCRAGLAGLASFTRGRPVASSPLICA